MSSRSSSSSERPTLQLAVGNLPSNRLALTNKVYVSPATLSQLGIRPDKKHPLVRVGPHPFMLEAHSQVEDGQIALNGLQRRYAQLSSGNARCRKVLSSAFQLCLGHN